MVHEVVKKLSDYVSRLSDTVAVVDGVPKRTSPPVCAWGSWQDEALAKQQGKTGTTRIPKEERVHLGDENHSQMYVGHDGDSVIFETQMYDADTGIQRNITRLAEEVEGGGWQQTSDTGHVMSPPMEEQTE